MKNKYILTVAIMLCVGFAVKAQTTTKIGYVDVDYILSEMPDAKEVESELKSHSAQLQKQIETKTEEYRKKLEEYQKSAATMIDAVRKSTENELTQLGQNIQTLQQDAQLSLQKKQAELMQPLYDKIGAKIKEVADAEGYSHILNARVGGLDVVVWAKDEFDISDTVLKKMGITPKPTN